MRTTTLALLSGAAMSISAASIYNVTPAGGFRDREMHASLEPLTRRAWPQLEPALAEAPSSAFAPLASAAAPASIAGSTAPPFRDEPAQTAAPLTTAVALATAAPRESTPQFAAAKPPSTKLASGWRGQRNPKPPPQPFVSLRSEPQPRVVVVRQEPQPMTTAPSFRSAPPASSGAVPASTSSAGPMSTSR